MNNKFENIPVEEDTKIKSTKPITVNSYDVVHQKWVWGGIYAESIIFFNDDIQHLAEEEVKEIVRDSLLVDNNPDLTYVKGEIYTFVNFNFEFF